MRDRPYIQANEPARPYGEVCAERDAGGARAARKRVLAEIAALEADAKGAAGEAERRELQGRAEALRCALQHAP